MKKVVLYYADDDTKFDNEDECIEYENKVKHVEQVLRENAIIKDCDGNIINIEDGEKYVLTVKAEGAPATGGVKINGDSDYKDYSQKESPIGDSFSIDAQANKGYKFDVTIVFKK